MRTTDEITDALELPCSAASRATAPCGVAGSDWLNRRGVVEEFRTLRANLRYYGVDEALSSLLVTSARSGEGKSTVALGLAANAARGGGATADGARVLLIECDLRSPVLAARVGLPDTAAGLAQVLAGMAQGTELISTYTLPDGSSFDILPAGGAVPNAAELLDSQQMRRFLEEVQAEYDLVILDGPAAGEVSDVIPLAARVSGVLFVTRLRRTNGDQAREAIDRLERVKARVLGIVVNDAQRRGGRRAGRYGGEPKTLAGTPS